MRRLAYSFLGILFATSLVAQVVQQAAMDKRPNFAAFDQLDIPKLSNAKRGSVPIRVAVIDDGFNLKHQSLREFVYRNGKEIPGNGIDDDGNGYIDDISGWDAEDSDPDVSIPEGREDFFYHGTMTAGGVVQILTRSFGTAAATLVKIVPVKVLSDQATTGNLQRGYSGIVYAVRSKVDIIVCAWSGGKYEPEVYGAIFEEAKQNGILILASAGNFFSEQVDPPASLSSVFAVGAIDSTFRKIASSNYGRKIDLCAAGEFVYAPHPARDNGYGYNDGTSSAVSLVAGCAAVLKVLHPDATPLRLMGALKATATPVDGVNNSYVGKLGAGIPNLTRAVQYLTEQGATEQLFNRLVPEGEILLEKKSKRTRWEIAPAGASNGIYFSLIGNWSDFKSPLEFFERDSLVASVLPAQFPLSLRLPRTPVVVEYRGKRGAAPFGLSYEIISVDSSTLYCKDVQKYTQTEGAFDDGSGSKDYANRCACKWLITVPQGKRVKLSFDEFHTESRIDFVHLYEGNATLQENLLAMFSGPELPPIIVSGSNQVLVWFVTSTAVTAPGWHLTYQATDEEPGVKAPIIKPN